MKSIKVKAILLAALTLTCSSLWITAPVSVAAESTASASSQKTTVVLDANQGATADSLQKALIENSDTDYQKNGRTVIRLVGKFTIDKTISLYSGAEIDATKATITGKNALLFVSYSKGGNIIRGGTWNLDKNSRLIKLSAAADNQLLSLTVNGGGSFQYGNVFLYNCSDTVVKGCTFNKSISQVIYTYSGYNITLAENKFNQADGHGIYVYGGSNDENGNLSDTKAHDIRLLGNTVNGAHGDGLKCVRCGKNCTVSGNTVKNITVNQDLDIDELRGTARSGVGIMVMECDNIMVGNACKYDGKTYSGNTISDTENYGMHVNLCNGTQINQTRFSAITTNGIHNSASGATVVQNCTFDNCGETAIFFTPGPVDTVAADMRAGKNSAIRNNTIRQCGSFGIELAKTADSTVSGNIVTNCKDYGIYCIGAKNITISGNSTGKTKTVNQSGIGCNEECSGIRLSDNRNMTVQLNQSALSLGKGETFTLKADVKNAKTRTVTWRTSHPKILTVTSAGKVTAVGTGTAWITARSADGIEASCKITVRNAPSKVTMSKGILTLGVGEKFTLTSSVDNGAAAAKRTYRSSNSSIVRMTRTDWQGEFTAVKPGTAYVTVRTYNGKEAPCKVTVKAAPTWVSLNQKTMTLKVGQTASLNAVIASNAGCASRTFRTSNSSIVKMTKTNWSGEFKAMKPGTAWVTVRTYNGKESSCKITVVR